MRQWKDDDAAPFAAMNADPEVRRHFPSLLTREESDAQLAHIRGGWISGFGLYAIEELASGDLVGFAGLAVPNFIAPINPCVEIGWRLRRQSWGAGYATEAAQFVVDVAFEELLLPRIVSFTAMDNVRSRNVMTRIGMVHRPELDFDHPKLPAGHPLARHVFYVIENR